MYKPAQVFLIVLSLSAVAIAQSGAGTEVGAGQSPAATQAPVLSPRTTAGPALDAGEGRIHLDVVVTDKAGKPVSGLELKDFTLLDDGRPAKILSFHGIDAVAQAASKPVEVILMLDAVNLGFQAVARTRLQLADFLRQNGGHLAAAGIHLSCSTTTVRRCWPSLRWMGMSWPQQLDQSESKMRVIRSVVAVRRSRPFRVVTQVDFDYCSNRSQTAGQEAAGVGGTGLAAAGPGSRFVIQGPARAFQLDCFSFHYAARGSYVAL
jgi:hypothetical protein